MHSSSLANMRYFRERYLDNLTDSPLTIYDLGSCDINGSYQPIFSEPGWSYRGIDMAPGKNVDIVLRNPYRWREVKSGSADVMVSGQAFEHMEYFWIAMLEVYRVLKPGGFCCLIAPSGGPEHRYPVDCYRFFPDAFKALASFASLEELETFCTENTEQYTDGSRMWKDTVFIGRKPQCRTAGRTLTGLKHRILMRLTGV